MADSLSALPTLCRQYHLRYWHAARELFVHSADSLSALPTLCRGFTYMFGILPLFDADSSSAGA
eukprot:2869370-Karenia_brevis.AAC.1